MRIALASDHAGYELKLGLIAYLSQKGIEHRDYGCGPSENVDYVDYARKAIERVCAGEYDRAILLCGTGLGMAVVANKYKGIRATACWNEYTATMSRKHNDSNCLTLGGRTTSLDEALRFVQIWLEADFEQGRHRIRLNKILEIEERNFKS